MTAQQNKAKSIFLNAAEIASDEARRAFVDDQCAGNEVLRAEVQNFLAHHDELGSFLQDPAPGLTTEFETKAVAEGPGTMIGPYKLLEQIGEGGFGLVFMAEQQRPVRRKVAVKILKPGMDTRQVIARFEAERQALALMDHPHIAKVLDAGTTETGRPHFVMELVRGVPITDYCDENRLTIRERLELFAHVCQAVQHAHHKGIIHRDIKPSNVLVTLHDGVPVVKVIDFGIAKALGQQLTDKTIFTGFAQMIGTPLYMSPEQAQLSGLDVDTRSDIYSLGVLLYELVTGTTPFERERLRAAGYDEMRRVIREEEPARPSTRLSTLGLAAATVSERRRSDPRRLTQLVRGELDWMVMKALEKDRNRRYETASAFALDVQRYLADEPVQACPPSAWYRCRKFTRRHRPGLAIAACLLLVVTTLAGSAGWIIRDRTAQRAERMRRSQEGLTAAQTLLADNQPALARQKLAEARAEIGADRAGAESLVAQLDAAEHELDRWQRFFHLIDRAHESEITDGTWQPGAAIPFHLEALSQYEALERDDWCDRLEHGLLGKELVQNIRRTAYEQLGWLADDTVIRKRDHRSGETLSPQAAAQAAGAYLRKAESTWPATLGFYDVRARLRDLQGDKEKAAADRKLVQETPPTIGWDFFLQGKAAFHARDRDKAIEAFKAALRVEPTHFWSLQWLGNCLCDLSRGPEDFTAAEVAFTGCIMMRPDYFHAYYCRGNCYRGLKKWDQAITEYTKAIDLNPRYCEAWQDRGAAYAKLNQWDNALADSSKAVELDSKNARAWVNRGNCYAGLEQAGRAMADFTKAIELDATCIFAWHNRGLVHANLKQWDQALADYSQTIQLEPTYVEAWYNRGNAYAILNQWDQALADHSKAIELDPKYVNAWYSRGSSYAHLKQWEQALADYSKAIELDRKIANAWITRGNVYLELKQWDQAVADYSKAIELDPLLVNAWIARGIVYLELKQWDQALADFSKAIELDSKNLSAWHIRGDTYKNLKRWDQALADYSKAIELNPEDARLWSNRGTLHKDMGQNEKALADYAKAVEVDPKDAEGHNNLAWLLANHPNPKLREPGRALEEAKKAVDLAPKEGGCWNTLGAAQFRAGNWKAAIEALNQSTNLQGENACDSFFQAMAHWRLGQKEEARKWHDQAVQWMDKHDPQDEELRRFRAESAELLGIVNPSPDKDRPEKEK